MDESAKAFLEFDYTETKDLCKHFLTLVSGVLVFSITFSEKIIDFPRASKTAKGLLLFSWVLFMAAIVCCAFGLYSIFKAGRLARHGSTADIYTVDVKRSNVLLH